DVPGLATAALEKRAGQRAAGNPRLQSGPLRPGRSGTLGSPGRMAQPSVRRPETTGGPGPRPGAPPPAVTAGRTPGRPGCPDPSVDAATDRTPLAGAPLYRIAGHPRRVGSSGSGRPHSGGGRRPNRPGSGRGPAPATGADLPGRD